MFKVKTHFNLSPAEYEQMRHGLAERCHDLLRQKLLTLGNAVSSVLEVGTGTGRMLAELAAAFPDKQFLGIDVEPRMIAYAQAKYRRPNLTYRLSDLADGAALPRCQFVYSIDLIHHLHDPLTCFQNLRRAMAPGGTWLAVEPNIFNPLVLFSQERMRRAGYDEDHLRPWVIEPLFARAGFAIASRRYAFLFPGQIRRLPAPLHLVERACERFRFVGVSVVYSLVAQ